MHTEIINSMAEQTNQKNERDGCRQSNRDGKWIFVWSKRRRVTMANANDAKRMTKNNAKLLPTSGRKGLLRWERDR